MKASFRQLVLIGLLIILQSFTIKRIDYRDGIRNNVCKELKGEVLVYYVFIDSKETAPWTEFDIQSTVDSLETAVNWIENKAKENNIALNIITDHYIGNDYTTIRKNLEHGSIENTAKTPSLKKGLDELNKWSDGIAARVGKDINVANKDGIPEIKNPRNKERLAAHLRDEYQVESVALLFMVNNYFQSDISLTVNHMNTNDLEFAIVSYKYPSVIAKNILNLFGAANLNRSIYRRNDKKIKIANKYFPDDIMQEVYGKSINSLKVGEFTKYLIGWKNNLDSKYDILLTDNIISF
jgi:hypothetical protein